jgi:uncharacterized protein
VYITRTIEKAAKAISETYPVLLVTGPRQAGKTTLLQKLASPERKYVTLDNPTFRDIANNEPELFLQRFSPPVVIDEIQYATGLLEYIKIYVDTHKNCGDFWLTGSQTFHMMKKVSETLAGRVGILRMIGLSNSEINGYSLPAFEVNPDTLISRLNTVNKMTMPEIFQRIHKGSMPRLYEMPQTERDGYYESYLETYISRDIKDLTQVADELSFFRFIGIVAARTATNVNYEALANETGITAPTAKQWLSVLVSGGLVLLVEPYFNNTLKRVIKAPRMFFLDTGLCAYLTRWNSPEALEAGAMSGDFFETWVVSEIYKSYINNGKRPPLYFYRDSNKKEIDVIIHQNNTVYPIEIKKSAAPKDAVKNFSVLKPIENEPSEEDRFSGAVLLKTDIGTGAVICLSSDVLPIDNKNWYIPAWMI